MDWGRRSGLLRAGVLRVRRAVVVSVLVHTIPVPYPSIHTQLEAMVTKLKAAEESGRAASAEAAKRLEAAQKAAAAELTERSRAAKAELAQKQEAWRKALAEAQDAANAKLNEARGEASVELAQVGSPAFHPPVPQPHPQARPRRI